MLSSFRYAIERLTAGVEPVVPLTLADLQRPLGPGYTVGFYGWEDLAGRIDNCRLENWRIRQLEQHYDIIQRRIVLGLSLEQIGNRLDVFHGVGHNAIGQDCSTSPPDEGVMMFSEVSARDPIFYRWHTYLENIVQNYRNTNYPK